MDAEMREYLEAMERRIVGQVRQGDERLEGRIAQIEERLEARIDAQGQMLRTEMAAMEQRLTENIQGRREDIDAAFGDIDSLRRAVRDLDKRVKALEAR